MRDFLIVIFFGFEEFWGFIGYRIFWWGFEVTEF